MQTIVPYKHNAAEFLQECLCKRSRNATSTFNNKYPKMLNLNNIHQAHYNSPTFIPVRLIADGRNKQIEIISLENVLKSQH